VNNVPDAWYPPGTYASSQVPVILIRTISSGGLETVDSVPLINVKRDPDPT